MPFANLRNAQIVKQQQKQRGVRPELVEPKGRRAVEGVSVCICILA